ncbi:uncharacterized protein LOC134077494 [Sardina pilchardus]|uniref:uncharacterized protein LOC134077494 n=1 Tax=Sardina pilchardus TaxID=27697 RepID=UPI002E14823E
MMASVLVVLSATIALSACTSCPKAYLEERFPGESFSLHCSTQEQQEQLELHKISKQKRISVMHVFKDVKTDDKTDTYDDQYKNRVEFTGPLKNLSIIITNLTEEDSGIYYCQYSNEVDGEPIVIMSNEVVALFVKRPAVLCPPELPPGYPTTTPTITSPNSTTNFLLALFSIFTAVVVFLMFSIMLVFYVIPKIKTLRAPQAAQNRGNDSVYEVMSATLKRT